MKKMLMSGLTFLVIAAASTAADPVLSNFGASISATNKATVTVSASGNIAYAAADGVIDEVKLHFAKVGANPPQSFAQGAATLQAGTVDLWAGTNVLFRDTVDVTYDVRFQIKYTPTGGAQVTTFLPLNSPPRLTIPKK